MAGLCVWVFVGGVYLPSGVVYILMFSIRGAGGRGGGDLS